MSVQDVKGRYPVRVDYHKVINRETSEEDGFYLVGPATSESKHTTRRGAIQRGMRNNLWGGLLKGPASLARIRGDEHWFGLGQHVSGSLACLTVSLRPKRTSFPVRVEAAP